MKNLRAYTTNWNLSNLIGKYKVFLKFLEEYRCNYPSKYWRLSSYTKILEYPILAAYLTVNKP